MNNHKSEYGVIQTIRFMIRQAVKEAPAVLVWLVVDAILALILQLLELYVTPVSREQVGPCRKGRQDHGPYA